MRVKIKKTKKVDPYLEGKDSGYKLGYRDCSVQNVKKAADMRHTILSYKDTIDSLRYRIIDLENVIKDREWLID